MEVLTSKDHNLHYGDHNLEFTFDSYQMYDVSPNFGLFIVRCAIRCTKCQCYIYNKLSGNNPLDLFNETFCKFKYNFIESCDDSKNLRICMKIMEE